jgi:hypothetical protein
MGFNPLTATDSDYVLLARAYSQYALAPDERDQVADVFGLILPPDRAGSAAAVEAWLNDHPSIESYLLALDPETDEPGRGAWRWETLIDDYQERPPVEWVVDGVIQAGALVVPFGPPAVGKTFVFQDLAICVALGRAWLEPKPDLRGRVSGYSCEQAPALWVDVDNGRDRVARRFRALARARNVEDPANVPLAHVSFPDPPFLAGDYEAVNRLIDYAHLAGARLIVLDNLGTISGASDENSSQMIRVMLGLRRLAETTGAAVVVIHHPNKAHEQIRGHTSILAAVDLALQIKEDEYEPADISVKSVKSRDMPVRPFGARFVYEHDEAGELDKARFWGVGRPQMEMTAQERAEACICKHLDDGMNQTGVVNLVKDRSGIGRSSALAAIKSLVDRGVLQEVPDGAQMLYQMGHNGNG